MNLKNLIMNVSYEDIEPSIEKAFLFYGLKATQKRKRAWKKMFNELRVMEPLENCDMKLSVTHGDVSGYYEEETKKAKGIEWPGVYSIVCTPWNECLGMEISEKSLSIMSAEEIIGNCIYEMSYFGYKSPAQV